MSNSDLSNSCDKQEFGGGITNAALPLYEGDCHTQCEHWVRNDRISEEIATAGFKNWVRNDRISEGIATAGFKNWVRNDSFS